MMNFLPDLSSIDLNSVGWPGAIIVASISFSGAWLGVTLLRGVFGLKK